MIPALHPAQLFHVGVVCEDIDAAMAEMNLTLGVTWQGGRAARMELCIFGEEREVEMRIAHSVQGPPHVELIQAVPDSPWASPTVGVHHLCYWSEEPLTLIATLEGAGARRVLGKDGSASGYFHLPGGMLVEVLGAETHDRLSGWIRKAEKQHG
ncbi:VOC family protein [Sphingobium sp. Sx8-8]|uniref:VOC family protein n=1 Tax=Sphingobium sp. Sx8-8 TaxID=2933617 RepID=UPI001F5978D6|nr:VOC family protein [Sphingobium sp. Sx8-8]